ISNQKDAERYISEARRKTDIERTAEGKEKTGIELKGVKAVNPGNGEEIPVFVADYALAHYGTGAVMVVPAHDERDFAFAKKFKLPVRHVIAPLLTRTTGNDAVRVGVEWKEREAVMCVVKHWKKDEFLCVEWKEFPEIRSFVSGKIEEGEDAVAAGIREIKEETGYLNPRLVRTLGSNLYAEFYHQVKKTNVRAKFTYLFFELKDGKQEQVSAEEKKLLTVSWKPRDEALSFITLQEKSFIKDMLSDTEAPYSGLGILTNSGEFSGLSSEAAKAAIAKKVGGRKKITFKLRDWIFSRQRYWGEPIPMIHCGKCGWQPVPEKDLPVELPKVKNYQPTDTGESPLAAIESWVKTKCPMCKGPARRETDVMPNWAGSSWYFLRYMDPKNAKAFAGEKALAYWQQVDWYNGGMEHTTLHLLYSRFWHKFLFDLKLVPTAEPYRKRTSHGLILAADGEKISKSKGNGINPDDVAERFGADSLRLYEMFMGPFDQAISWNDDGPVGMYRFLERVWRLAGKVSARAKLSAEAETLLHQSIEKVSKDIESMRFNTAISQMMVLTNALERGTVVPAAAYKTLLRLLAPFAPHITEELWQELGGKKSIHREAWPSADKEKLVESTATVAVQVNGKVRATLVLRADANDAEAFSMAERLPEMEKWLVGQEIRKRIYVPGRIVNFVI
ncbi:MAG TPA: class I tRNA ligase family protein, partial [Candidatus Paceibacterota bacterium]|nr:class I tRNA ligase family protein [Candidatus Paceibacterota bacterium]